MNTIEEPTLVKSTPNSEKTPSPGRQVGISMTLFPESASSANTKDGSSAMTGTGTVSSECGTTAYAITTSLKPVANDARIELQSLHLAGQRLSGFDAGEMRLVLKEPAYGKIDPQQRFSISGPVQYVDANNENLLLNLTLEGTIQDGVVNDLELSATGNGFHFAKYLADDERLDEESGDEGSDEDGDE